ncbi:hypothetical protein HUG17_0578 [Dermatophagoides farinae]|uniref:Uncharacterized protein n=1 Tax=Dermatophagoides farinae TaxID=6954 RepID=A0A9D4SL27_DERFA|nr:hypothetical protein HUG17_0578 [Dermatophagoides farinae]
MFGVIIGIAVGILSRCMQTSISGHHFPSPFIRSSSWFDYIDFSVNNNNNRNRRIVPTTNEEEMIEFPLQRDHRSSSINMDDVSNMDSVVVNVDEHDYDQRSSTTTINFVTANND